MDLRRQLVPDGDVGAELTQTVAVAIEGLTFGIAAETVEQTTRERVEELDAGCDRAGPGGAGRGPAAADRRRMKEAMP